MLYTEGVIFKRRLKMKKKFSVVFAALAVLIVCICATGCNKDPVPQYTVYTGVNTVAEIEAYWPEFSLKDNYWTRYVFTDKNFNAILERGGLKKQSFTEVEIENKFKDLGIADKHYSELKKHFLEPTGHYFVFARDGNNVEIFGK